MATVQVPTISYYSGVVLYGFGGSDLNDFDVRFRIYLYNLMIGASGEQRYGIPVEIFVKKWISIKRVAAH